MRSANWNLSWLKSFVFVAGVFLLFTSPKMGQVVAPAAVPELVSIPKAVRPASASSYFGSTVVVNVDVDKKGRVRSVLGVSGPEYACPAANSPDINKMREAAQAVALKARFKPAKIDGKAVASTATIEVVFPDPPQMREVKSGAIRLMRVGDPDVKTIQGDTATAADAILKPAAPAGSTATQTSDPDNAAPTTPKTPNVKSDQATDTINGGVLNGKALSLPKPGYPAAAKAVRASGSISVQVLIGEDGSILSANAVSGHPLLRQASRNAACTSKFTPTLLSGNPVKVLGFIVYNFVP